jgi:hypothetical protein
MNFKAGKPRPYGMRGGRRPPLRDAPGYFHIYAIRSKVGFKAGYRAWYSGYNLR